MVQQLGNRFSYTVASTTTVNHGTMVTTLLLKQLICFYSDNNINRFLSQHLGGYFLKSFRLYEERILESLSWLQLCIIYTEFWILPTIEGQCWAVLKATLNMQAG